MSSLAEYTHNTHSNGHCYVEVEKDPGMGVVGSRVGRGSGGVGVYCLHVHHQKCVHRQITSNLPFMIR